MKYDLKDIATVSGLPGLYKVLSPSKNGVILETIDDVKKRMMSQTRHRISLLQEISIFTNSADNSVPLEDVFTTILKKHKDGISLDPKKATTPDLNAFIKSIVPDYDEEKVYTSDIKKLISWYNIISKYYKPVSDKPEKKETEKKEEKEKAPAKKAAAKPKAAAAKKSSSPATKKKPAAKKPAAKKKEAK